MKQRLSNIRKEGLDDPYQTPSNMKRRLSNIRNEHPDNPYQTPSNMKQGVQEDSNKQQVVLHWTL
jgi:hypothetical protein